LEARFIILHPDDPGEILLATSLIRCLKTQVEEALVYSVVSDSNRWLLDHNPYLDELFIYQNKPDELTDQLADFLPDYLIDLDGTRLVRRLKNRLKVLDFTIKRKKSGDSWVERAFVTCRLFDIHDDCKGSQLVAPPLDPALLPSEFLRGYIVLSLDSSTGKRSLSDDQIIELVVMTEKPIVISGPAASRQLADKIGQSTGCAVFPTCGDLTLRQNLSLLGSAKGAIVFDPMWDQLASALGTERKLITANGDADFLKNIALWARSLIAAIA
jgi:ADP-heptose:LPS heptosyltransferase